MHSHSSRARKPSRRPTSRPGKWHTFSGSEKSSTAWSSSPCRAIPREHTGYEFFVERTKVLFWGDIVHALRVQVQHPEITAMFDVDQAAAAATRHQWC